MVEIVKKVSGAVLMRFPVNIQFSGCYRNAAQCNGNPLFFAAHLPNKFAYDHHSHTLKNPRARLRTTH